MSVASSLSEVLRRRRVQVAVAVIALGGAVTAVAVANVALLDVAGRAQDPVGGLSARIDLAPATPLAASAAATTAPAAAVTTVATPTRPALSTVRDDGHEAPGSDRGSADADGRDGRDD